MNEEELLYFNKRLNKFKKISINFFVISIVCFLGTFGYVIEMNPVKTDVKGTFSDAKGIIILIMLLIIGIITFIINLIYKAKTKKCLSIIDFEKYEECNICKSIKLKETECSFPHNEKENIFMPSMIFLAILVTFIIVCLMFF